MSPELSICPPNCQLLDKTTFQRNNTNQVKLLQKANDSVKLLFDLFQRKNDLLFFDVLKCINETGLFDIPLKLIPLTAFELKELQDEGDPPEADAAALETAAWKKFLLTPFRQVEPYLSYILEESEFATHHGVKGLEFDRVMAVLDDSEAKGFTFKYEKLFNGSGSDATMRLFYVICSRATKSLAITMYAEKVEEVRDCIVDDLKWFAASEVVEVE